ncbi:hypothetical protein PHYBOEH_010250 [Phytophthora boehmeriae]|uniref:C2 domain-containing protein n=1 Tax=Phytophthora boehmeriae TaxID=109152 RepID=A0A8T1X6P1_9STRA|nr:hypothetical protein PHYBOEH_010250 [Phytophthora boehmeriae]
MYAPSPAVRPPTSSVELSLSAKSLKDRDIISKSDPFAVLFVKSGAAWSKIGQTEAKKDDLNPIWAKLFVVEFHFEALQQFKVEVYDQDSSAPNRLQEQDFIGAAEFTLGQIMGSPGQSGSFLLTRGKHKAKHQGSLLVKAEEVKASNEAARLRFSASGLANMDGMFSKSDPFLVISRLREDGNSWTQVHRSETIDNNLNPNWRRFEISLQQLCNGDYRRSISLQVFDEDRGGRAELIGQVNTTLEELLAKRGTNFILHNEALKKKKGKKYTNAGLLVLSEGEIYREHSFIDYLRGGLEMNLVIGIDYTASNGPPNDPRSLHFIDPRGPNQYQHAISATVSILQEYDSDKQFPVYGFGGIPPGAVQFVPYSRFAGYPEALTRETLAEIPYQLCQYMKLSQRQASSSILYKPNNCRHRRASILRKGNLCQFSKALRCNPSSSKSHRASIHSKATHRSKGSLCKDTQPNKVIHRNPSSSKPHWASIRHKATHRSKGSLCKDTQPNKVIHRKGMLSQATLLKVTRPMEHPLDTQVTAGDLPRP